jgi:hypothetical protein
VITESSYLPAIEALESLGPSLHAVRLSRGKSLRKCAAEMGISFSTVNRVESGEDCDLGSALAILRWLATPPGVAAVEVRVNPALAIDLSDPDTEPVVRVWTCAQCGKREPWGPGWAWFGNYRQLDLTGEPEFVVCSTACRQRSATREGHDAALLNAAEDGGDDV